MEQFDFNQVGKRMPYSVPNGFFDQLEENVMKDVRGQKDDVRGGANRKKALYIALRVAMAAAAAIALFLVVSSLLPKDSADGFDSVQLAYNNLSDEDQEFLSEIYEEDEFINIITNTEEYEENI